MKHVGIFFSAPGFDDEPFSNPDYRKSYHDLAAVIRSKGGECVIVRDAKTFTGAGTFSHGWIYRDGAFVSTGGPVKTDVVYNKGEAFQADEKTAMVNHRELDDLCRNKQKTVAAFTEYFPASALVQSAADLSAALSGLAGDTLVAKPTDGWGGHGVTVAARGELFQKIETYPVLVQEFIDTSKGIPGIVDGAHDLRILMVGGRVALSYVRTPPEGSKVANLAQGGTILLVPDAKIPPAALAIAKAIDDRLSPIGRRVYSVDMGLHDGCEWKLFELNPQPGLTSLKWGEAVKRYYEYLAEELLR
jgi:glutathione synthase/RimK-type ligase-like ATP-grasp enzyme